MVSQCKLIYSITKSVNDRMATLMFTNQPCFVISVYEKKIKIIEKNMLIAPTHNYTVFSF